VEYQREGYDMFAAMMDGIKEESVGFLFNIDVEVTEDEEAEPAGVVEGEEFTLSPAAAAATAGRHPSIQAKGLNAPQEQTGLTYTAPSETGDTEVRRGDEAAADPFAGISRNALCPCGSGKKYKRCHGAPGGPTGTTARIS
jgi:preprotein translocase subunit SecA